MIDFHTHMLPGIDDGAGFFSDSLQMARMALKDGVRGVVLTPHHHQGRYNNGRQKVLAHTEALRKKLKREGIKLEIFPGSEVHLQSDLAEQVAYSSMATINDRGKHLLVELPFGHLPIFTGQVLEKLKDQGVTPILAHPERCRPLVEDPLFLFELVSGGILLQLNAGSVTGDFGEEWADAAGMMIRQRWVHLIGSDAHSVHQRPPVLSGAVEMIRGLAGSEAAKMISSAWPREILQGRHIHPWDPLSPPPRQV